MDNRELKINKLNNELALLMINNKHLSKIQLGNSGLTAKMNKLKENIKLLNKRNSINKIRLDIFNFSTNSETSNITSK